MKTLSREASLLQQEQVERLMQIGAYLRHVREEKSLPLEDVAARTMIQSRLLKAIEEGKLHHLPEPVYIQGFIRRYAEALGLDGSEFAEAFPSERSLQVESSWKDSPAAQLRPLHLYIAYVALIMVSVSLLSYIVGRSANSANSSLRPQVSQAIAPAGSSIDNSGDRLTGRSAATRIQSIASPSARPQQTKPVQIEVKLTAQSWLEVEADGVVKTAEVLPEGTERSWTADKQIRVRAGNAGGVQVVANGGKAAPMGVPGAVEEKTFTPSSSPDSANSGANTVPSSDSNPASNTDSNNTDSNPQ
jgi:cytoskeletal protein RodZ